METFRIINNAKAYRLSVRGVNYPFADGFACDSLI